jgi:ribonucleoside-diphosphate reductase alpha chain
MASSSKNTNRLAISRLFTTEGVNPYDEIAWTSRDVVQTNWKTGEVIFEQRGVSFPDFWSDNAVAIVTTKYFRGAPNTPEREDGLKKLIDRVVGTYVKAAKDHGYFSTAKDLSVLKDELTYMLVNQFFSFNSPVWFNVGTSSPQQVSACFILAVEDSMDSILDWYKEEGLIFKGGSGAGVNLSRIRSSKELLKSSGGTPSGPVSFMRGADASAGTIKSGGATRRAAKMVVLDVDHPDIEEFIETKVREEDKIRVLRDAGYDMDLGGKDSTSVQYQNANNSVRVSHLFMGAVRDGGEFGLIARKSGEVVESVDARTLFRSIAQAAWACADPGIQYDDTINDWHTAPETGRINASNPCSEYMSLDNSSCNLASMNLMKFVSAEGVFDAETFAQAVRIVTIAMEISISFADFPTKAIGETTRDFRQLGIGYANLGALLMSKGLAYDSGEGRAFAAAITSVLTGAAYSASAELAAAVGPYSGYKKNAKAHTNVMHMHADEARTLLAHVSGEESNNTMFGKVIAAYPEAVSVAQVGVEQWSNSISLGKSHGWRNSQASVLAPTGTIGFMMDCDTTGIEPDFSLVKFKKLVGGGSMTILNGQVDSALTSLGYGPAARKSVGEHILANGSVTNCKDLAEADKAVFDCAVGESAISPEGHIYMMAAVQPFLSGAISKTVNLPETATVEDIESVYMQGWDLGLKALAVYRDNCKVGQPLSSGSAAKSDLPSPEVSSAPPEPIRRRLPRKRQSYTTSFKIGEVEGYMTVGQYDDGSPGEIFVKVSKQGSTLAGIMDAFAMSTSVALQYGVPLETFVSKLSNARFEPAGLTNDPDIRLAQSVMDYIVRRLALDYLPFANRSAYGIYSTSERAAALDTGVYAPVEEDLISASAVAPEARGDVAVNAAHDHQPSVGLKGDAPLCMTCGTAEGMTRSGSCFACHFCGGSSGCS